MLKRDVPLPRPRELDVTYTPEFGEIVHELRGHIGALEEGRRGDRAMTARRHLQSQAHWLLLLAIVALWQSICGLFDVSEFLFPSPARIAQQFWEHHAT